MADHDVVDRLLAEQGYEPIATPEGDVKLRNCVFHELADQERDLVCSMNQAWLQGVVEALPGAGMAARLQPEPGRCCVVLTLEGSGRKDA